MGVSVTTSNADPIAEQIAALDAQLCGPRAAKADMLREARHGLIDAAEAHEADGVPAPQAVRLAIDEFGEPARVARDFQVELAARQSRSALAFLACLGPVMEVSSRILWSNSPRPSHPVSDTAFFLAQFQDVAAWVVSVLAAMALIAFGMGARWLAFRSGFVRTVAYTLLAHLAFMMSLGAALTMLFDPGRPRGAASVFEYVYGPAAVAVGVYMVWLAWRCLRTARRAEALNAR